MPELELGALYKAKQTSTFTTVHGASRRVTRVHRTGNNGTKPMEGTIVQDSIVCLMSLDTNLQATWNDNTLYTFSLVFYQNGTEYEMHTSSTGDTKALSLLTKRFFNSFEKVV